MKKVHIKSALPIYISAAVWLLAGLIAPRALLNLPSLLLVTAISAAAGFAARRFFPGRTVEVQEKVRTGDPDLDEDISRGLAQLQKLREADAAISHPEISRNLARMTQAGEQIFLELARDRQKAGLVRRFMNYYLPTSEKLMDQYQILMAAPTKGDNIQSAMARIEDSLGMIAEAFEKCLDGLFADREMDIDAEIQVMQTMLASDGLIGSATGDIRDRKPEENQTLTMGGR